MSNCIFSGNSASSGDGGGMNNSYSSPTVTNCTFSGNSARDGGGIYNSESSPRVTNCILWGDTPNEITNNYDSSPIVTYSDVQGGYDGENNINADPLFTSAADFHLQAGSPCLDAGNNSAVPSGITADLDGSLRIMDGDGNGTATVDMGAYECPTTYDIVNDLSSTTNPNGTWSYGWESSLGQTFNLYDVCDDSQFEGSPIWYSSLYHPPEVWKNTGSDTGYGV